MRRLLLAVALLVMATIAGAQVVCVGGGCSPATPIALANGGTGLSSAADDTVLLSNGSAWQAAAVANCTDSGGNHLNYTAASNSFSCGTSSSSSGITSGTTTITSGVDKSIGFNDAGIANFGDAGITYTKSTGEEILAATTDSALLRIGSLAGGLTFSPVNNGNTAVIGHGAERVSGAWTARNTSASLFGASVDSSQAFVVYANTGLTSGNTYSPSQAFVVTLAGNMGIGSTSPTSRFVVDGGAIVSSATGMHFAVDASGGEIQTFGSKTLRLNALGNNIVFGAAAVPVSAALADVGSAALPWKDAWFAGSSGTPATNNFRITGTATAARVVTLPDASSTVAEIGVNQTFTGTQTFSTVDAATFKLSTVTQTFPKTFTATYDPASLAAATARCDTVTVTGITTTGGAVTANIGAVNPAAGCVVATVRASAADTVTICWMNTFSAATACDTASSTWTFTQAQ